MDAQKWNRLPPMIRDAREKAGVAQKALAADLGIDASQLCALEKGRRGPQGTETLAQIANVLRLNAAALSELTWAMSHDRVMASLRLSGLAEAAPLVSLALQATHALSTTERKGLEDMLADLLKGKHQLSKLEHRLQKEATMT